MTREDIENNVGYWQEKANLEYIRQRQEHGVNDPYMITEINEAFDAGYDKGYQCALHHQWIPVEEELPKENEEVLAYNAESEEVIACDYHHKMFRCWPEAFNESITHWMQMPQPPQGKEE